MKLRYFSDLDNFGGINNMDNDFLKILDRVRHVIKHIGHVLAGFSTSGHSRNSIHHKNPSYATDIYFKYGNKKYELNVEDINELHKNLDLLINSNEERTILDMIIISKLSGIKRIGVYPFGIPRTYFHFDTADSKTDFWIGLNINTLMNRLSKIIGLNPNDLKFITDKANKVGKKRFYIYPI